MADAAEAGGHLCSGVHGTHLACLHLLCPPMTSAKPQGLRIKLRRKAAKKESAPFLFACEPAMQPAAGLPESQKL